MNRSITLVEVGPRDGLQNETTPVPTEVKVAYVDALSAAGLPEIEVSSFVSPTWVPQLADAAEVFAGITRRPGTRYTALVPNTQGMERALVCVVDGLAVFTAASESFTQRNINASIAASLERFRPIFAASPVPVRGYLSTAFHCPFEGPVTHEAVRRVTHSLLDLGAVQVSVSDTIGRATPDEVCRLLEMLLRDVPAAQVALHFHDTFGEARANAEAGAGFGITVFDGSTGGIGGCPFAPGAAGNIDTETLAELFDGRTGVDRTALQAAAALIRPWRTRD